MIFKKIVKKLIKVSFKLNYRQQSNLITANKSFINICVFGGHQDGKSTLCSAISKVFSQFNSTKFIPINQLNNAQEEIEQGTTIYSSELFVFNQDYIFSIQDGPGKDCFLYNSIMSFNRDAIVLVISPYTSLPLIRRNLIILKHFDSKNVIIFVNKIESVNDETVRLMKEKILNQLKLIQYDKVTSIIYGSALAAFKKDNLDYDQKPIINLVQKFSSLNNPIRDLISPSLMLIEVVGYSKNNGIFIKGVLNSGTLTKGQFVDLIGLDKEATCQISDIQLLNESVNRVQAGTPIVLNFKNLHKSEVKKGMILCSPSTRITYDHVECKIYCFNIEEHEDNQVEYKNGFYDLWSNWFRVGARVKIFENQILKPKQEVAAILELAASVALKIDAKFLLTLNYKIIGIGTITKLLPNLSQAEKIRLAKRW